MCLSSQLLSLVGDDVISEVDKTNESENTPPSPPPTLKPRTLSMVSDGEPPAIPVRTQESYQLIKSIPEEDSPESYGNVNSQGVGGVDDYEMVPALSGPVVKDVPVSVYEAPTPCEHH